MATPITRQEANQLSLDFYTYRDKAQVLLDKCYAEIRNAATLGLSETTVSWNIPSLDPLPEESLNITMNTLGELGFDVYVINKERKPYPPPEKEISIQWSSTILDSIG